MTDAIRYLKKNCIPTYFFFNVLFFFSDKPTATALKRQKTLQQVDLDLPFLDDPKIEKNELAKYLEQEINEQVCITMLLGNS